MTIRQTIYACTIAVVVAALQLGGCGSGGKESFANLTASDLFKLGKERYDNKKYFSAAEAFQTLVYNYPGESIVDTAQYYLGLSYFGNEDYELAQAEFNRLLVNYPSSAYANHAEFMRAVAAFESTPKSAGLDQSKLEGAIKLLEDFILDHPESELVPDVNKYLTLARTRLAQKFYNAGVTYTRMGAAKASIVYYQKVVDDYTDTEFAPLANFALAQAQMDLHNYDEARQRFEGFAAAFPEHKLAAGARAKAPEAAFRAAVASFQKNDLTVAAEKFESFKRDFPNDSRTRKADEYLAKINQQPADKTPQANAQSK